MIQVCGNTKLQWGTHGYSGETGVTEEIAKNTQKYRRIAARYPLCHNHFHGELASRLAREP
jgi:hypothetical protein